MKRLKGFRVRADEPHAAAGLPRPERRAALVIGQRDDHAYVIASEPCALYAVGARLIRDVQPGELVWIDRTGLHS